MNNSTNLLFNQGSDLLEMLWVCHCGATRHQEQALDATFHLLDKGHEGLATKIGQYLRMVISCGGSPLVHVLTFVTEATRIVGPPPEQPAYTRYPLSISACVSIVTKTFVGPDMKLRTGGASLAGLLLDALRAQDTCKSFFYMYKSAVKLRHGRNLHDQGEGDTRA
jgi:hypothetical protein